MKTIDLRIGRRAFFFKATAALGAGVAATAGATAPVKQATPVDDREAIRQLHLSWMRLMESGDHAAVAALFDAQATLTQFGTQLAPALHLAYRPNARQHLDALSAQDHGEYAGSWNVDVAVGSPLAGDSTAAQMARLQGNLGDRHWESGILHARYRRSGGEWKIAALEYRPA
jgi:hypothetical protein